MKIDVSIVIVHYKVKEELFNCLNSILISKPKINYEIIVVDNDEVKVIEKELKTQFPTVRYVKSGQNRGFGAGNNLGAEYAKGKFIFFLNPDTLIKDGAIDELVKFLEKNKKTGIVAPLLLDSKDNPYPLQGTQELTPFRALFALSFLNKIFPKNPVSRNFWQIGWNKNQNHTVNVVPGTAFMIERKLFEKIGKFDENYFLYFEENDLCRRVSRLGYEIQILSNARVVHLWESSTKQRNDISKIFKKSRFYYLKKNYGLFSALFVNSVLNIGRESFLVFTFIVLSLVMLLNRLSELMPFIGDQGWFYISARNLILSGNIPLVGITSSHIWIHQGPIWTYLLSLALWIFRFNPVGGPYLTVFLGIITIYLIYSLGKKMFGARTGLIAALLYSFSPLVILNARMAYHTAPIALFSLLLLYSAYCWVKGKVTYFPVVIFLLALLYNFELATFVLDFAVIGILIFGLVRKKSYALKVLSRKVLGFSLLGFAVPMIPFLIYDPSRGFPQTLKFVAWLGYKVLVFLGFIRKSNADSSSIFTMVNFISENYTKLIFGPSGLISFLILITSFIFFIWISYKMYRSKNISISHVVLFVFILVPFLGFIANKTPSDAYIPIFFPTIILLTALFFDQLMAFKRLKLLVVIFLIALSLANADYLFRNNYFAGITMKQRIYKVNEILAAAKGRRYKLIGKGEGSQFESFTMNYEYLLWWKGNPPVKDNTSLTFTIEEKKDSIIIGEIEK